MTIERDIHDLLYTHDCVIVPGFGGFLTHYRPARLDEQRKLIHPPAKDLSFNRHLVRQDGLLADEVAKREDIDFHLAKTTIDRQVETWKGKLEREGRLEMMRIGTFFHDGERNLQFEPDKRVNFLKDAMGLRPVAALPVVRPEPVPVEPVPSRGTLRNAEAAGEEPRKNRAFWAAAATVAVLLTAATWWTVTSDAPKGAIWSGFDLFRTGEAPRYALPKPPTPLPAHTSPDLPWTAPEDRSGIQALPIAGEDAPLVAVDLGQAPVKAEPESTAVAVSPVHAHFHIIGGCFQQKENADRFIAELQAKGFAASLIDVKGGLYRVAYGSYPQRTMALDALNAVRKEEAPDAWLLVK
jgi:nucleoid DNA-binding protein/cell division septation protein DedD